MKPKTVNVAVRDDYSKWVNVRLHTLQSPKYMLDGTEDSCRHFIGGKSNISNNKHSRHWIFPMLTNNLFTKSPKLLLLFDGQSRI